MAYTFDEAIEELRLAIPEKFYQPTMHDVAVILENQNNVIEKLREEYAPTIEMTKSQHELFVASAEGIATQEQLDSFVDEELDLGNMTVRKGLNAWLHPETIKVIEEEK
ncbi:hypothetical protein [Leuconostoc gasicomitatum]|uniref:hypothetical protein n=1 Tax=Leuconostoc gasicomitatum TaxID=115778 RepID=UPI001CC60356|nr:hypothetical protein [Leuconostoc gasicomitatum]MBZ5958163.1 hypothetical protein [Leuconostoc gasicomitatum]